MEKLNSNEKLFAGYIERIKIADHKINPIHEIVNTYYRINGWENMDKTFYKGRYAYGKLSAEAKRLYTACGESLDDAMWSLYRMEEKANKGGFDWSIITCLKHKLKW